MRHSLHKLLMPFAGILLFTFAFAIKANAQQNPSIATDQAVYSSGATVSISGRDFAPNETVTLQVLAPDASKDNDPAYLDWSVQADSSGNITSTWTIPVDQEIQGATLVLTAYGQSSSLQTEQSFTIKTEPQPRNATVTTDKPDYAPRSTAIFTGNGFEPGENVVLKVKNLFKPCNTVSADSSYTPWTVTADANGSFVTTWTVCDCLGDSLRLKATGQTSGAIAYAYFSDAVSISGPASACLGSSVTYTATSVTGFTSITGYQWMKNGNDIPGANSTSYTINSTTINDAGAYSLKVSGVVAFIIPLTQTSNSITLAIDPPPSVTSGAATGISYNQATLAGTITATGCSPVTAYGVEISTTNSFADGSGTKFFGSNLAGGNFSVIVNSLTHNTTYYYHAFATNSSGTDYGSQGSFKTLEQTVTTSTISGSPFCVTPSTSANVSVPFTSTGTFSGNTYTAQLSSATGSFSNPTDIGTLVSNANSGTISAVIPANTATGTGYRIRVKSSNPSITGGNSAAFTINRFTNSISPATTQNIVTGVNGNTLTVTASGSTSRTWFYGTTSGGPYSTNTGVTNSSYTPNFATPGTYYVVCVSNFACGSVTSNEVLVNVAPTYKSTWVSTNVGTPNWCQGETRTITVTVKNTGTGTWSNSPAAMNIGVKWDEDGDYGFSIPRVSVESGAPAGPVEPGETVTYTFSNVPASEITGTNHLTFDIVREGVCWFAGAGACDASNVTSVSQALTINATPTAVVIAPSDATICNGAIQQLSAASTLTVNNSVAASSGTIGDASGNPYRTTQKNAKTQFIYTAAQLSAAGLANGSSITSLSFNVTSLPASVTFTSFNITAGLTTTSSYAFGGAFITGLSSVYSQANQGLVAGLNTFTLSTPITWNGTSNIVFDVCWSQNAVGSSSATIATVASSSNTVNQTSNTSGSSVCGVTTNGNRTSSRPFIALGFNKTPSITWAPITGLYTNAGATTPYTGTALNTVYAKPTTTQTYTATAANATCTSTGNVSITVNQPPSITQQPESRTITYGEAAEFSVKADGTPELEYQWEIDLGDGSGFFPLDGETSTTLHAEQPSVAPNGYYLLHVIVTNECSSVTSNDVKLTVNPKAATIIANDKSKIYGEQNPDLDAEVAGTINEEALDYTLATTADEFSGVGPYPITVTLGENPNYSITITNGTLTVGQKAATIAANNKSKIYGDDNPTFDAVVNGTVNGDDLNYTLSTTALKYSGVGPYPITVALGENPNYTITPTDATLTIGQRSATIIAKDKVKIYGDNNPPLDATVGGTVNGDVLNYTLATTAQQFSGIGNYPIAVTLGANANYSITKTDANLHIDKKTATITADNQSKTYGEANPALTATVVGQVAGGDAINYTLATTAEKLSNIGNYPIAVTLGSNPNYDVTSVDATLHIDQKTATVTADNKSKTYGEANPALTATVVGQVTGGDAINYTLATTAEKLSNIGNYPIAVTLGSNPNYDVTSADGTLHIDQKTATVTADNKSKTYGEANPALTATVVGQVTGGDAINYTLTTTAEQFSDIGNYPIAVTLGVNLNYSVTNADGTLHIDKRPITISADAKSKTWGDIDPALTYEITSGSLVNGDVFTGALARVDGESAIDNPSIYEIQQGSILLNSNYDLKYVKNYLSIYPRPIIASASAGSIACFGGTTTITVTASGGDGESLMYKLNDGSYQSGNTFIVGASATPYVITIKDEEGFTTTTSVLVTQPLALSASVTNEKGETTINRHLYYGYAGDQTTAIKVSPTGGTAPYTVKIIMDRKLICNAVNAAGDEVWTSSISSGCVKQDLNTVCGVPPVAGDTGTIGTKIGTGGYLMVSATLLDTAIITYIVTDKNGCSYTRSDSIFSEDARCFAGKDNKIVKVQLCHRTGSEKNPCVSICVDSSAVADHLAHGDSFGACPKTGCGVSYANQSPLGIAQTLDEAAGKLQAKIMPNPSVRGVPFILTAKGKSKEEIEIRVVNIVGQEVYKVKGSINDTYRFGSEFRSGVYIVQVIQGQSVQILKVIKQ